MNQTKPASHFRNILIASGLAAITIFSAGGCELAPELLPGEGDDVVGVGGHGGVPSTDDNSNDDGIVTGSGGKGSGTGTGGDSSVPPSVCGNGKLERGELCDDKNTKDDDGCSADCLDVDPDYLCLEEGKPCERVITCGNGIIEGSEKCDDKNEKANDGCAKDCSKVEDGYSCVKPGEPCVLLAVCGNGQRERGEQCDDAQDKPASGDGCSKTCQQEDGFFCPPGEACVELDCGDGYRTPDEACDDGDSDDGNGCSAACEVETGWYCSASGCKPVCGDGLIRGTETCDDSDKESGDGCSAACRVEPFYTCNNTSGTSVCTSTIACGNGIVEPGEICDPGISGQEDCFSPQENAVQACKAFETILPEPVCGNHVIELEEACDGDQGNGGCVACEVTDGFVCPKADNCVRLPSCGDGYLQTGEECDPGAMSATGCTTCTIDDNYFCSGQPSVCVASVCGDGVRAPDEQCDDPRRCVAGANAGTICTGNGNCPGSTCAPQPADDDGCSSICEIEDGYICPPGVKCLAECGDGKVNGNEECDSTDTTGCKNCRLQPGYQCGPNGNTAPCTKSVCGNGTKEQGEGCDPSPGNIVAGDGCGPTCQLEPTFSGWPDPTIPADKKCGDGIKLTTEGCDDGNKTDGDGCSSNCTEETGWLCAESVTYPSSIDFKVTYRDFTYRTDSVNGGHPHMNSGSDDTALPIALDLGVVGAACTTANAATCGRLDTQGKPQFDSTTSNPSITGAGGMDLTYHTAAFALWYRDSNTTNTKVWADRANQGTATGQNVVIRPDPTPVPAGGDVLTLGRVGTTAAYQFSSAGNQFYPLGSTANPTKTSRGFGTYTNSGNTRNWNFTSELRYYFQYKGNETLTFFGDDDVWVFINGRLAVDIGGIHGTAYGRVLLGDSSSDCSVHGQGSLPALGTCYSTGEQGEATDLRFNITKGSVYEIVVFQAERRPTDSNYQLTLDGFIAPRSSCNTTCGDGIIAGSEVCDVGNGSPNGGGMPTSGYNTCLYVAANDPKNCTFQFCGDKVKNGGEYCDNGLNIDAYGTGAGQCAPGCLQPARCGDGNVQPSEGEECDLGSAMNTGAYGGCTSQCKFAPYCGDKVKQSNETCDPADGKFATYGAGKCGYDCKAAPFCGDNLRNGGELCDGTANCNANCEYDPFCGDGLKTMDETCDNGSFNEDPAPYDGCTTACEFGPRCGDDAIQGGAGEECDDGEDNQDGEYDRCNTSCLLGPNCGDSVAQTEFGETCDNGFNEDVYAYPGTTGACGAGCKGVPSCGDNKLQSSYELCDNGSKNNDNAYNGCTTLCDWGPYCGDSVKNGSEACDNGPKNVAYSKDGKGCSYTCTSDVPYCGDGTRNGPELCDLGKANNTGAYGKCNADCSLAPYCGDHVIQKSAGEECDDGPSGSLDCSNTCDDRTIFE